MVTDVFLFSFVTIGRKVATLRNLVYSTGAKKCCTGLSGHLHSKGGCAVQLGMSCTNEFHYEKKFQKYSVH